MPPNFDNDEIKDKFNRLLCDQFDNYINFPTIDNENKQLTINTMYFQLTSSIQSSYKHCSRVVSIDHVKKNKIWFTKELNNIKIEMFSIRYKLIQSTEDIIELKRLKKCFKNVMKRNIFLYEKNEYIKLEI